jgi:hypothetical protein
MNRRSASRLGWALFIVTNGLLLVMVFLSAGREEAFDTILYGLLAFSYAGVGALVVSRHPRNSIGWILLSLGVSDALWECAEGWGYFAAERGLPGGAIGEWIILTSWILDFALLTALLFLFPDGALPGNRWRPWLWIVAVGTILALAGQALDPGLGPEFRSGVNPTAVEALPTDGLLFTGMGLMFASLAAAIVSLVVRFRRGTYTERQQLKWIAVAASQLLVVGIVAVLFWYDSVVVQIAIAFALISLPVAAGVAIFKYGLYEVDIIINRALVYGLLTALLAFAYVVAVVVLQRALAPFTEQSGLAVAGSTLLVVALFRPVRSRIQDLIDRRFYRAKYDAARTLEGFGARLKSEVDLEALAGELVTVVKSTLQPAHASVWLKMAGTAGSRITEDRSPSGSNRDGE